MFDFRINVAGGAGHVACAHGLATGGLHGFIEIAGHPLLGDVFRMCAAVVVFVAQCQSIRRASCQQNFVACHPTADLWQAHLFSGNTRRINGIGHRKLGVIGHHLGGFRQRLLEGIGGVIGCFFHHSFPNLDKHVALSDLYSSSSLKGVGSSTA